MPNRLSAGCRCCSGEPVSCLNGCIDDEGPAEFQLELTDAGFTTEVACYDPFLDGLPYDGQCEDNVPGTYVLPYTGSCLWTGYITGAPTICGRNAWRFRITILTDGSDRKLIVSIESNFSGPGESALYQKNYGAVDIDCTGLTDEVIPFLSENDDNQTCDNWDLLTVKVTAL